jgi:hypothetical protein
MIYEQDVEGEPRYVYYGETNADYSPLFWSNEARRFAWSRRTIWMLARGRIISPDDCEANRR